MKTAAWVVVGLLILSASARAQVDCDQARTQATWKKNTLFALTYKCIPPGWDAFFNDATVKAEVKKISNQLRQEVRAGGNVNPAMGNVFRALYAVSPNQIKAVIIGQDPAPTQGQATGLAFSLAPGAPPFRVPSVQRVILEAANEGFSMDVSNGDLSSWAGRSVLMLNTALTIPCPADIYASCKIGGHLVLWKAFSTKLIDAIDAQNSAQAFILWGSKAAALAPRIDNPLHRVFKGGHPSPVSDGKKFFCKSYFTCSNKWLEDHDISKIEWSITEGSAGHEPCVWSRGKAPKCVSTCTLAACD